MDKEVIVQVFANGEQIVVQLLNLLVLPQNLYIFHLIVDHLVKPNDKFFLQFICKLVA